MAPNATRYCSFPNLKNKKDIEKWMDDIWIMKKITF
jgi:hypothetical protein